MSNASLIKKYGNRRLYDTNESRYVTLDELAAKVQGGTDVRVVDAKSGEDLTQTTLTQLFIEGRGASKMLPVPLLQQLIRLDDEALAEFLGSYMPMALAMYFHNQPQAPAGYSPLATLPFVTSDTLGRMFMIGPFGTSRAVHPPGNWGTSMPSPEPNIGQPAAIADDQPATAPGRADSVAELRRELDELKRTLLQRTDAPPKPKRPRSRKPQGRERK